MYIITNQRGTDYTSVFMDVLSIIQNVLVHSYNSEYN